MPEEEIYAELSSSDPGFVFERLLLPAGRPSAAGRTIAAIPALGANLHRFSIADVEGESVFWSIDIIGDGTRAFELPEAPGELYDPLRGQLGLNVEAFSLTGTDLGREVPVNLGEYMQSWSISRAQIEL
jgi:hypothetical protein